jgi:hypothetical protein
MIAVLPASSSGTILAEIAKTCDLCTSCLMRVCGVCGVCVQAVCFLQAPEVRYILYPYIETQPPITRDQGYEMK